VTRTCLYTRAIGRGECVEGSSRERSGRSGYGRIVLVIAGVRGVVVIVIRIGCCVATAVAITPTTATKGG
jgi:hypothetical protein